jgi:hypothetical protein
MDISQDDILRIAADEATSIQQERMGEEELLLALSVSQSTAEDDARRRASWRRLRKEYDETRLALSASRVEDEQAMLRRIAVAEAEAQDLEAARRQEEEDMAADARRASEHEAAARRSEEEQLARAMVASRAEVERKALQEPEVPSRYLEQRRLQAAQEEEEALHRAMIASRVAADRGRKHQGENFAREIAAHQASAAEEEARLVKATAGLSLRDAHCVDGLSEEEHLQLALLQSREQEDAAQAEEVERVRYEMLRKRNENDPTRNVIARTSVMAQRSNRWVPGVMASSPPEPVTGKEVTSVGGGPEWAENPDAFYGLLTPQSNRSSTPGSNTSQVADSGVGMDTLGDTYRTTTSEPAIQERRSVGGFRNAALNALYSKTHRTQQPPDAFSSPYSYMTSSRAPTDPRSPTLRVEPHSEQSSPPVYPGANPPSPSTASVPLRRAVSRDATGILTPVPIGAYPLSGMSTETQRDDMNGFKTSSINAGFLAAPSQTYSTLIGAMGGCIVPESTPRPIGAYPPSHQGGEANRSTLSSGSDSYRPNIVGAYPPSPSQISVVPRRAVTYSNTRAGTPVPIGAYPFSHEGSELSLNESGSVSVPNVLARHTRSHTHTSVPPRRDVRTSTSDIGSPEPVGSYPQSYRDSGVPTRAGTISSKAPFDTAQQDSTLKIAVPPQASGKAAHQRSKSTNDAFLQHAEQEAHRGHSLGSSPSSAQISDALSAPRPAASKTSLVRDVRVPPRRSLTRSGSAAQQSALKAAATTPITTVLKPAEAPVSSHPEQIRYHFNGPVTVNNYNIHVGHERKTSMLKQVLTKGARLIEHKDGAGLDFKSVTEAANAIKNHTASWLETGAARIRKTQSHTPTFIERHVDASPAPMSEVAEVVEMQEAILCETMNEEDSIDRPNQINRQLYCINADPSRTTLATPANGAPSFPGFLLPQAVPVPPRPLTPANQIVGSLSVQRRLVPGTPVTGSMVSDPNANAVTPPTDGQSEPTISGHLDDSSTSNPLYDSPTPPSTVVRRSPPPVPRKPAHLVDPFGSPLSRPAVPNPSPSVGHAQTQSQPQLQQLQQFRFPPQPQQPQQPTQFPIMYPTAGYNPNMSDSPSSLCGSVPTPERVTAALGRSHGHVRWNSDLANVPPPERTIDDYHSRSINDLSRYNGVGDPHVMAPLQRQHEAMYARGNIGEDEDEVVLKNTPLAKRKEKDQQKYLRGQLSGGRM